MRNRSMSWMLVAACCLVISGVARAADWPCWRGPNRNGTSPETGVSTAWPAEGPKKVWEYKIGGGHSSPVIADKKLYTQAGGNLVCFDAATGEVLWKCPLGEKGATTNYYTPAVDGGVVYGMNDRGLLAAVEAATGKPLWTVDLLKELAVQIKDKEPLPLGSPLVLGDRIFLSRGVALEKATGKLVWKVADLVSNGRYETATPFTSGKTEALLFYNGPKLVAVTRDKGSPLWSVDLPWWAKNSYCDPIVLSDLVFFDGQPLKLADDKVEAVKGAKGLGAGIANPALWKDCVYASCGGWGSDPKPDSYELKCADPRTGEVKWSQKGIWGPLLVVDDKVLVATHKGEIVAVKASPDGYQELARAMICPGAEKDVCWATPAFADGKFYMRRGGLLVCLDLSGK